MIKVLGGGKKRTRKRVYFYFFLFFQQLIEILELPARFPFKSPLNCPRERPSQGETNTRFKKTYEKQILVVYYIHSETSGYPGLPYPCHPPQLPPPPSRLDEIS